MSIYDQVQEMVPMPEKAKRKGLTVGDYLRIASSGLEILGAPSEGSGFKGTLASASKPLSELGVDLGTSIDARDQKIEEDFISRLEKIAPNINGIVVSDFVYGVITKKILEKIR